MGFHVGHIGGVDASLSVHLLNQFLLHATGRERDALLLVTVRVTARIHQGGVGTTRDARLLQEQHHTRFGPDVPVTWGKGMLAQW